MTTITKLKAALAALEAQHADRLAYSRAKRKAQATCASFTPSNLQELIESGYMHSIGKETEYAITELSSVIAEMEAGEPVAWITPDGEGFRIRFSPPTHEVKMGWDALFTHPQTNLEKVSLEELKAIYQKYGTGRFDGFLEASKALFAIAQQKA